MEFVRYIFSKSDYISLFLTCHPDICPPVILSFCTTFPPVILLSCHLVTLSYCPPVFWSSCNHFLLVSSCPPPGSPSTCSWSPRFPVEAAPSSLWSTRPSKTRIQQSCEWKCLFLIIRARFICNYFEDIAGETLLSKFYSSLNRPPGNFSV